MTVHFDVDAATLRLDRETFDSLAAWVRGGEGNGGHLADLRSVGAVRNGRPHPSLLPGLGAVADPVCRLRLWLRDGHRPRKVGEGWVAADAATLLLELPDGLCEFVAVHPTFLPVALVNLVGLGPRPRLPDPSPALLAPPVLDELLDRDGAGREQAARRLAAAARIEDSSWLRALVTGGRRMWGADARWGSGSRGLQVLDTAVGIWLIEGTNDGVALRPTTPTEVWRRLVGLLPRQTEVA
jgi:hypothetical protein